MTSAEADAQAIDFDLACMWFAQWVESRAHETIEKPVSARERRRQVKRVPKYPTLKEQLGLASTGGAQGPDMPAKEDTPDEIAEKADELIKNPDLLVDFLRLNGEG